MVSTKLETRSKRQQQHYFSIIFLIFKHSNSKSCFFRNFHKKFSKKTTIWGYSAFHWFTSLVFSKFYMVFLMTFTVTWKAWRNFGKKNFTILEPYVFFKSVTYLLYLFFHCLDIIFSRFDLLFKLLDFIIQNKFEFF